MKIIRNISPNYRASRVYPYIDQEDVTSMDHDIYFELFHDRHDGVWDNVTVWYVSNNNRYVDLTLFYDALMVVRAIYAEWTT